MVLCSCTLKNKTGYCLEVECFSADRYDIWANFAVGHVRVVASQQAAPQENGRQVTGTRSSDQMITLDASGPDVGHIVNFPGCTCNIYVAIYAYISPARIPTHERKLLTRCSVLEINRELLDAALTKEDTNWIKYRNSTTPRSLVAPVNVERPLRGGEFFCIACRHEDNSYWYPEEGRKQYNCLYDAMLVSLDLKIPHILCIDTAEVFFRTRSSLTSHQEEPAAAHRALQQWVRENPFPKDVPDAK